MTTVIFICQNITLRIHHWSFFRAKIEICRVVFSNCHSSPAEKVHHRAESPKHGFLENFAVVLLTLFGYLVDLCQFS